MGLVRGRAWSLVGGIGTEIVIFVGYGEGSEH